MKDKDAGKLVWVNNMKRSKEILTGIMETVQICQVSLQCALNVPISATLQAALRAQLQEYDRIEAEARSIAFSRGWNLEDFELGFITFKKVWTKIRYTFGNTDYKAIAMTITHNTKGMIRNLHNLRQFNHSDERISALSQKLLDIENANIRQMQGFL